MLLRKSIIFAAIITSKNDANKEVNRVIRLRIKKITSKCMRAIWIWQQADWPHFYWDDSEIISKLSRVRMKQGMLLGELNGLGFEIQRNASLEAITEDVIRSSEIEGVFLDPARVRSSVASRLGLETQGLPTPDHYTEGIVEAMLDAVYNANEPLTKERLCGWHASLFPTGRSGMYQITVADYRKGETPMQIVSGAFGHERVHYEAPASAVVPAEMEKFLGWVNEESNIDSVLKAAVAHLWFVAIHPFDDGNGRLTRTITDMLLSRADGQKTRFYSMSAEIMRRRNSYYDALQRTNTGNLCITDWLSWFLETMEAAIDGSYEVVDRVKKKAVFWQKNNGLALNERQIKILNRLFEGFEGKLTTSKYAKITHNSQATALRDIQDLVEKGLLTKTDSGGRSSSYELAE